MKDCILPISNTNSYNNIMSSWNMSDFIDFMRLKDMIQYNPNLYKQFLYDTLESGVLKFDHSTEEAILSNQAIKVIKGRIFESAIVSIANRFKDTKKELFLRATKNKRVNNKHLDKHKLIGTGFVSVKKKYPQFYNPGDNKDALFIRPNNKTFKAEPAIVKGSTNIAPIQIKAVRHNSSLRNIVESKLNNRYDGVVLTCLMYNNMVHTKDKCIEIVKDLRDVRKMILEGRSVSLNKEVRNGIISSIIAPEDILIPQKLINEYEMFIECWVNGAKGLNSDQLYGCIESSLIILNELIQGNQIGIGYNFKDEVLKLCGN